MAESVSDISFVDKPYGLKGSKRRCSATARLRRKMAMAMAFTGAKNSICSSLILTPSASLDQVQTKNFNSLCSLFDAPSNSLSFCLLFLPQWITFVSLFLPFVFSLSFLLHDVAIASSLLQSRFFPPLVLKDFMISHNSSFCGCRIFVLREFCAFLAHVFCFLLRFFRHYPCSRSLFRLISGLSFG